MSREKPVSGKKVVVVSLLLTVLFTVGMGFGTYTCAQYMTPMLKKRAEEARAKAPADASRAPRAQN